MGREYVFVSLRRDDCGVEPRTPTVQDDASLMWRTMGSSSGPTSSAPAHAVGHECGLAAGSPSG